MRNRLVMAICILSLAFTLVACGKGEDNHDTSVLNTETSTVESETSSQEEIASEETTEVVKNEEESETTPVTEENTESAPKDEPSEEPKQPESEEKEPEPPAHKHDYTKVVTKEPGCIYSGELGEATFTCSCGHSYTEEVDTVYCDQTRDGIRVTTKEPNCQHQGRTCEHCKYCGNEIFPEVIPTIDHIPGEWLEVPSQGKRYKLCTMCAITLEIEDLE